MSLKDRVQVEPLDDDRWSRVERGVIAGVRTRAMGDSRAVRGYGAGRWAWAGVAVAAAAAGVLVARGAWRRAGATGGGASDAHAMTIATEARGTRVEVGGAVVTASPETSFTIARPGDETGGGVELALARGRIELDVPHRPDRAPLIVHAGDVDVVDVGTIFSVARDGGAGSVSVEVREGEVQVARAGKVLRITAGQRWSEPVVAIAGASVVTPAGGASVNGAGPASAGASATSSSGVTGPSAITARDRGAAIPVGGPGDLLQRAHTAVAPGGAAAAPAHRREHAAVGAQLADHGETPSAGSGSDVITDLGAAIRAVPIEPSVDVGAANATAAFAIYRDRYTSGGDALASKMLYGMARAQFAAGRTDDALRWLDAYLERFTSGDEAEAVRWLRVRILCTRGDAIDDACRAAASTYLAHGSDATRSKIAQLITDTIR